MAKSYHNNKNTNIKNFALQTIRFDQQQLFKNDIDNYKINNILKPTQEQKYESFFRKKLLKKHITSQLEDLDFIHLYIYLEKYLLSQVITS